MQRNTVASSSVRLAEVMAALSLATDLGMGQPLDFALCSCLLATRLGEALRLREDDLRDAYYYALLRYVGCTAETHVLAAFFGDELALRQDFATLDLGNTPEMLSFIFRHVREAHAGQPPLHFARLVAQGLVAARSVTKREFSGHCEVAQRLATRLGFGQGIVEALGQLYERWDGRGLPKGAGARTWPCLHGWSHWPRIWSSSIVCMASRRRWRWRGSEKAQPTIHKWPSVSASRRRSFWPG